MSVMVVATSIPGSTCVQGRSVVKAGFQPEFTSVGQSESVSKAGSQSDGGNDRLVHEASQHYVEFELEKFLSPMSILLVVQCGPTIDGTKSTSPPLGFLQQQLKHGQVDLCTSISFVQLSHFPLGQMM